MQEKSSPQYIDLEKEYPDEPVIVKKYEEGCFCKRDVVEDLEVKNIDNMNIVRPEDLAFKVTWKMRSDGTVPDKNYQTY